ncbi:MAG TPA: transposase domain-containing protein [Streptosporangiaceae bacterium]|nr:transposase domain-containing protein [Streptosporangiaceae bacterium]
MRSQSAIGTAVTAIIWTVTVAAGVFAPGHLGELTRIVPFEMADAVLEETRARERRLRVLPSRAVLYFVLAMCLFPGTGYLGVWAKLTAALDGLGLAVPSARALRDLRRRLGAAPLHALFEVLAGPLAQPSAPGARFGRYRTVAFDGCKSVKVPDTVRNRAWLGNRRPPVLAHLPDGSVLSLIGGVKVRIITAEVTVTCHDGTSYGTSYRLATTLLDHRAWPADALIALYHERWEHEIAYLALRHTLLAGRVLRSGDPAGLQQEMWALLALYQALRIAITDAVATIPGTDPDRASYQIAVQTAQTLVTGARGILAGATDLAGDIGRAVLANLHTPTPRLRPQSQIPAQPLEQAPARQARHEPASHQDHHRDPPGPPAASNTPPPVLDTDGRSLTPRHWG